MIVSDKAVFRIVPRHASVFVGNLAEAIAHDAKQPPLTGCIVCPRGCGTRIYWALAACVAEYQEQFLMILNQQLSWTACPDHKKILSQRLFKPEPAERDWTYLPSPSAILGGGPHYANCYE